ncbi:MAG: glycerol-3-phosphate acyltransferase [Chloroflexota bacterium]
MAPTITVVLSYLLGSIPFAYIIGRLFKGIDIRKVGDGNVGSVNAYQEIGPAAGLLVLAFDIAKGVAAIFIAQHFVSQFVVLLAGLAVVAGHIWPVFLGFKGGRGEATTGGVLLTLLPWEMLILLAIAIIPFVITRNTMLLGAILFAPLWLVGLLMGAESNLIIYSAARPGIVGIAHFLTTRRLPADIKRKGRYMR